MPFPSFSKGDILCSKCGIWIYKIDIPNVTRFGNDGRLLHECGWAVRIKPRRNIERIRKSAAMNRPIRLGHSVREDIKLNKEKWEKLVKNKT